MNYTHLPNTCLKDCLHSNVTFTVNEVLRCNIFAFGNSIESIEKSEFIYYISKEYQFGIIIGDFLLKNTAVGWRITHSNDLENIFEIGQLTIYENILKRHSWLFDSCYVFHVGRQIKEVQCFEEELSKDKGVADIYRDFCLDYELPALAEYLWENYVSRQRT
jgi:hypothetical protein